MDRMDIAAPLVARLIADRFPQWADREVRPVDVGGWDNATFRLGEDLVVRLPTAQRYAPAVDKEHRWLPVLAPSLPLPIPEVVGRAEPALGYPWPWSVRRWLPGRPATTGPIADRVRFAMDLADFLAALHRIDPTGGPPAGEHSFFRGGPVAVYDAEVTAAIAQLRSGIDAVAVGRVWRAALGAVWRGPAVWVHGDVGAANLLVRSGRLAAVIDFGALAVGDPACDLVVAWTGLGPAARAAFARRLGLDAATWTRARGWALWKALITLAGSGGRDPAARRVIDVVTADPDGA